ncbi:universal stress protein [Mycolicibacterium nivoides]|uniref:Universal stress protein n=1 Tax=Mycolicibacterium nivoides TaxID=2487344 RepID=A0ABW9LD53_9MYCO
MSEKHFPAVIVAGIDGSQAALEAARWAADEAVRRSVRLRLVYATKPTHPSADDYYADVHRGQAALAAATAACEAADVPAVVESAMVSGPPGHALIEESDGAAMICVGSVGIGRYARSVLGSTAIELAEKAHCPTAIIRGRDDLPPVDIHWIIFAIKDSGDESVTAQAMSEARLRHAPVLALGNRGSAFDIEVDALKRRYPDVRLYPVSDNADVAQFLREHDEPVQLAVISADDSDQLPQILGPFGHHAFHLFRHATSSALVVPA